MAEVVAVAVHLQDVDVVGEPVQQRAGRPLRPEDLGPLIERPGRTSQRPSRRLAC